MQAVRVNLKASATFITAHISSISRFTIIAHIFNLEKVIAGKRRCVLEVGIIRLVYFNSIGKTDSNLRENPKTHQHKLSLYT